jgi:RNA polymerase sigma-70 factor, ECF subfamily
VPALEATASDRALSARALGGDSEAFATLVRQHHVSVVRLCQRYLGMADAEDAAQETFIRCFVHRARLDPARPLRPWLLTVARRLCLDRLRQRHARREDALVEEPLGQHEPEAHAAARLDARRALAVLPRLAEGPREALTLFHLEGLTYREIAEVLEVPAGTVMTWLHRAREQVREAIESTPEVHIAGAMP